MLTMRDTYTAFDTCHPAVPATYFAATILIAIFAMQPVCVGISLAGALMFSLAARHRHSCMGYHFRHCAEEHGKRHDKDLPQ